MPKVVIYEPALCCPTGICGVNVDPELLRISTVLNALKNKNIEVTRYNLAQNPQDFVSNSVVSACLKEHGVAKLPLTLVDDVITITARYPSNEELAAFFNLSADELKSESAAPQILGIKAKL